MCRQTTALIDWINTKKKKAHCSISSSSQFKKCPYWKSDILFIQAQTYSTETFLYAMLSENF